VSTLLQLQLQRQNQLTLLCDLQLKLIVLQALLHLLLLLLQRSVELLGLISSSCCSNCAFSACIQKAKEHECRFDT
jgi:hypothetical protein